ncbi:S41 family peptidase [Oscillibacter sp.]|uniref:S41 family peptidase n=1 Tax=Oscillibacter sp. TaxID=1945593 RepID=UPI0028A82340|nr:S41 family peptidase [Oscillibacter sp.]
MKRKIASGILAIALSFSLVACGSNQVDNQEGRTGSVSSDVFYTNKRLSNEQLLSDYDAMWKAMKESYPFWGVLARSRPQDPGYYNAVISDYRGQLQGVEAGSDEAMYQFLSIVANSLYEVCGMVGHVSIVNPNHFEGLGVYKEYVDEMPEVQPWVDVIEKPEVISFYEYCDYLRTLPLEDTSNAETEDDKSSEQAEIESMPANANLTTNILEEGKTAYIRVDSFDDSYIDADLPKIQTFLEEVKNYDNLIIDIQNNGGGNTDYWEKAFVRPNLAEPVNSRLIRLMKDTQLARQFYMLQYQDSTLSMEAVKDDPELKELSSEDMADLSLARELSEPVEPDTGEKMFHGKIWVLVGSAVYSSAEAFAVFCKDTGFATLVGQTTGGSDSGGPILFELPNSHLLVQFDVEYCLNADGSCNQETGTVPDIEAEDALHKVLSLIERP